MMSIMVGVFLLVIELILFCTYYYKRNIQLENLANLINPSEIKSVISKYKFESNVFVLIWLLVILIGIVMGVIFNRYPSIPTAFFFLSLIIYLILLVKPNADANEYLEKENVDNEIMKVKSRPNDSIKYIKEIMVLYLIPLAFAIVNLAFVILKAKNYFAISALAFANVILSAYCNNKMIYSSKIKKWTMFFLLSSSVNNLILLYLILSVANLIIYNQYLTVISIFLTVILTILTFFGGFVTSDLENKVVPYKNDDIKDNKIFYNDSNREKTFIQRSNGDLTINIAQVKGKALILLVLILLIALLVAFPVYLIISDFYTPGLQIRNDTVYINDLDYSTNFQISDVQTISLSENVPNTFKLNGSENSYYARGLYKITDCNKSAYIYIFKASKPYIIIKLKTCYVIYNRLSENDTLKSYAILKKSNK